MHFVGNISVGFLGFISFGILFTIKTVKKPEKIQTKVHITAVYVTFESTHLQGRVFKFTF